MSDILSPSSATAKLLLDHGFISSKREMSKNEALGWAADIGHSRLVQLLVSEGADANAQDEYGLTSVHKAASGGSCKVISILRRANAITSAKEKDGLTPLHYAAQFGRCDAVSLLVAGLGADPRSQSNTLTTPLHLAAQGGHVQAIQLLYNLNADIRCQDQKGLTPLHTAARYGHLYAVQLLIQLGSDIAWRASFGRTLAHIAAQSCSLAVLKYLGNIAMPILKGEDDDGASVLCYAVQSNDCETVKVLLRHNVSVDQKDKRLGYDAVTTAAWYGNTKILRLLANNKATLNTRTAAGDSPIHLAAYQDHQEAMQYLLENGADIELHNFANMTPLHVASWAGKRVAAQILVDHGARIKARGPKNFTALHYAVMADDVVLVRYFLKKGSDIEAKTDKGATALSIAAQRGREDIVSVLLDRSANIATKDDDLYTPIHHAAHHGHQAVLELLLDSGADPTTKTKNGRTVQSVAVQQGHMAIANLLAQRTQASKQDLKDSASRLTAAVTSASRNGNVAEISRLISEGLNVNMTDLNGRTALSTAAENGQKLVLSLLLHSQANPDLRDTNGESPLWWAARYGHEDIVRMLLASNVYVDAADSGGQTPLSVACQKGFEGIVRCLLENGSDPNSVSYGKTALLFAVTGGHYRVVKQLINFGADIDYISPQKETALSLANAHNQEDISKLLQSLGAPEAPPDREAKYAKNLIDAVKNGRLAEVTRLIRTGVKVSGSNAKFNTPIAWAASEGQDAAVSTLIEHGAPADAKDKHNRTPLYFAASQGHMSTIRLLYNEGARLDTQDMDGLAPLQCASIFGRQKAVNLLIQLGAEKETEDQKLRTALWHAVSNGHMAVVETLLENGADIESADACGFTPLAEAVRTDNHPLVKLLLERGALVMWPEFIANRSPLCLASAIGSESLVELLIEHGADLNHQSKNGATPIAIAAKEGYTMVVKILIEMGADVQIKDEDGRTALSYAKELGNEPMVKLLSQAATLLQANSRAMRKAEQETLDQRMKYEYHPLKQEGYIRILELDPGKKGDIISFELYDVDISKTYSYSFDALSYEWKEKSGTIPVQCGRERLLVTPNCKAALERIRHETDKRALWVDSVCINQEDKQECNQQVAMMTEIYRKARSVIMWIGEGDNHAGAAFHHISTLRQIHKALRKDVNGPSWEHFAIEEHPAIQDLARDLMKDQVAIDSLKTLLSSEYFKRAWIFQEILLAGIRGIVMCGQHRCSWESFKAALLGSTCVTAIPFFQIASFYEIVRCDDLLRRFGHLELFNMSLAMTAFKASDPKDKIFATLRLASANDSGRVKPPVADYTLTVQEVYVNASRYFIDTYKGMSVWDLTHRSSAKTLPNLPSWAPDFMRPMKDLYSTAFSPNYQSFVEGRPTTTPVVLRINGCLIDKVAFKVSVTKEMDVYGIVKQAVLALARHNRSVYEFYETHNLHPQPWTQITNVGAALDTIFTSKKVTGYNQEQVIAFLGRKLSADSDTPACSKQAPRYLHDLINSWEARSQARDDFDLDICHNMEDVLRYDTDFVYTENGHFGLTNKGEAEEGLWVAIVGGSHDLVLLREKRSNGDTWYEFVDKVFLNHYGRRVERLEDMRGDRTVRRLEIR